MNRKLIDKTIWAEFFQPKQSKGQKRMAQIVLAAVHIIAKEGPDFLTFDALAKECGSTRQLIIHYFPDRNQLLLWGAKFVRSHMQQFAVSKLIKKSSPNGQLTEYVKSTFLWIDEFPAFANFWMYYYYLCSIHLDFRKQNSELVDMGHDRIEALIKAGNDLKQFSCSDPKGTAKVIQNLITGSLISHLTEQQNPSKNEKWTLQSINALLRSQ